MVRVALAAMFVLGACGGGGQPAPDAGPDAQLRGPAPSSCEEVVANNDACSSYESVCAGVCGAAWECCYPSQDDDGNETWGIVFIDCPLCDAGVD